MAALGTVGRVHFVPTQFVDRQGCPCTMTPTLQVSIGTGTRRALVNELATMRLVHATKTGEVKNELSLAAIHNELELASLQLRAAGAKSSNILLATVSFDCKVTDLLGQISRKYVCFDLKIPGEGTPQCDAVFSYESVLEMYGSQQSVYDVIKAFYKQGRAGVNPLDCKHGHETEILSKVMF